MENNNTQIFYSRVVGQDCEEFYSALGQRLGLPKPISKRILKILESEGRVRVKWRGKGGCKFFVNGQGRKVI